MVRANAICKRLSSELASPGNAVRSKQDIIGVAEQRAASEQTALTELSKLTPPSSMAQGYLQMLTARQQLIEDLRNLGRDVAVGNTAAEAAVYSSSGIVLQRIATMARGVGLKYCGMLG